MKMLGISQTRRDTFLTWNIYVSFNSLADLLERGSKLSSEPTVPGKLYYYEIKVLCVYTHIDIVKMK